MIVLGADVHKRTHTFVAVDERGRKVGEKVVPATTEGHLTALAWAKTVFGNDLLWGIEDCRNLSARLERDLLSAGQKVVRVAPKL
ncbi:IS110 family transposase, partial [Mycolicibacter minnesotensis]